MRATLAKGDERRYSNAITVTERYVYNKLFTKILDSSIWLAPDPHRLVWVTLLAVMDEDGNAFFACADNLAARARVTVEQAEAAISMFEAPDPKSGDPENEGRRIERFPGGWHVLNAHKYRAIVTKAIARERTRDRVAKHRASKAECNATVTPSNDPVTPSEAVSEARSISRAKNKDTSAAPPDVQAVFDHWKLTWNHEKADLDLKRRKRIEDRLKKFSVAEVCEAISGFLNSAWHTGKDPNGGGRVYDKIETLLREDSQVEEGIRLFRHPPVAPEKPKQLSPVERVMLANGGASKNERVVSEQRSNEGMGDIFGNVRDTPHAGFRRIGS